MYQQHLPTGCLPSRPRAIALALHLMLAGVALPALLPAAAIAAEPAAAKKSYNIAAGALGDVLAQFAASAGIRLSFDPALVAGQRSAGLQGSFAVNEGFARILAGSGYDLVDVSNGAYSLHKLPQPVTTGNEATLPAVKVTASADPSGNLPSAYAGGKVARGGRLGMLGNVDVMDAPFNITSFTSQTIEDQQARTIAEIVARDPSVRSTAPSGDVADAFFIRGFPIGDNNIGEIAMDGLYGVAPNYRLMAEYAERIEVLKGPAAMIYGMSPNSGVGGAINVVPKRAEDDLTRIRADYATDSQVGGHMDLARRFGTDRQFGVRFNGSYHDGDTPIDHQSRKATLGAVALDYQGERLRATLDLIDQRDHVDAPSRRPWLSAGLAVPDAPDNRTNVTQRWEWYESTEQSALLRAEFQAHEQLSVFVGLGTAQTEVDRFFNTPVIINAAGDTTVTPTRANFDVERSSAEAGVRGRLSTGPVKHQMTLQWSGYEDRLGMGTVAGQAYTSNIHTPLDRPTQNVAAPDAVTKRSTNRLGGIALADTMSMFDDRVRVMLGLRKQHVRSDNFAINGTKTSSYDKSAVTPMAGLVVNPWQHISLYANYIEGLSKGDIAPNTAANAGEVFAPYEARQQEIGVKIDHGRVMTTLSAFRISRPSGQMTGTLFSADGEQVNRGVELSAYGAVGHGLRLYGGATWIDAELTKTNNAATIGNTAVGVPEVQVALNAEWDLPLLAGLTLTGGLLHSGKQYANQANTQRLPAWTTLDVGLRYRSALGGKPLTVRADVRNVSDKDYWAGASTWGTLIAGAPRTFLLSATVDF
jgi:iron complex outermembrane receptor protein